MRFAPLRESRQLSALQVSITGHNPRTLNGESMSLTWRRIIDLPQFMRSSFVHTGERKVLSEMHAFPFGDSHIACKRCFVKSRKTNGRQIERTRVIAWALEELDSAGLNTDGDRRRKRGKISRFRRLSLSFFSRCRAYAQPSSFVENPRTGRRKIKIDRGLLHNVKLIFIVLLHATPGWTPWTGEKLSRKKAGQRWKFTNVYANERNVGERARHVRE